MAKKIIVVDDEPDLRNLLKMALEGKGYEVHTAGDGVEGKEAIEKISPDLVLLDLKMPRLNGYELTLELKRNPQTRHIPIIILTSLTEGSQKLDEEWRESLEVADFVSKPWDNDDLFRRVETVIGN